MKRHLIAILTIALGLLVLAACNNPSAAPATPEPTTPTPTDPTEPTEPTEPAPPMITDLLGLEGWDRTADRNYFSWTIRAATGNNQALVNFFFVFTDDGDDVVVGTAISDAATGAITNLACADMSAETNPEVSISGGMATITITIGNDTGEASCAEPFAGYNRDPDDDASAAFGTSTDDQAVFELMLSLPNIMPVENAKDQKIAITGNVTLSGSSGDATTTFPIRNTEVTYETPNIMIEKAN